MGASFETNLSRNYINCNKDCNDKRQLKVRKKTEVKLKPTRDFLFRSSSSVCSVGVFQGWSWFKKTVKTPTASYLKLKAGFYRIIRDFIDCFNFWSDFRGKPEPFYRNHPIYTVYVQFF